MDNKHVAFVNKDSIQNLCDNNVLKSFDLIITKDRDIIYYLDDTKKPIPIRSEVMIFESEKDAITAINLDTNRSSIQVGQNVIIKNSTNNKYSMYIINTKDNKFIVEPVYDPNLLKLSNLSNDINFQTDKDVDNTIITKILPCSTEDIKAISTNNDSIV